ncbi:DUF885 domain-containing protein [Spiractinospora alimapuensis]|uniref:DUF885 domain-containing protein n=1 Tax=Spiractinospora alimapuensis TaxID=2820884 RepID=UPI001F20A6F0|nr:DUF885 domain-containing protein [Spiractinospora alimapuensis]QVQ52105.1 DUF885 domain-containing protein [Spiractinospora alimapuensis]
MSDQELAAIATDFFAAQQRAEPFHATLGGIPGYDAEVPDRTEAGEERLLATYRALRHRVTELADAPLSPSDDITRRMVERSIDTEIETLLWRSPEYTATTFEFGPQSQVLELVPKARVTDREGANAYLERTAQLGRFLDACAERLRAGLRRGRTPYATGIRASITQIHDYLAMDLDADPLLEPIDAEESPASPAQRESLSRILSEEVRPAIARLAETLDSELLPAARPDERCGLAHLDGGDHIYAEAVRHHTTLDTPAETIHEIGLECVADLADQYRALARSALGTTDLTEIFTRLREDPDLVFDPREEAVTAASRAVERAEAAAPAWFRHLPRRPYTIREFSEIESRGHSVAMYQPGGATDGPGVYWINTHGPVTHRHNAEAVAFHEVIPGHHLQVALAEELLALPEFRRFGNVTPYVEGWGLYAEVLADEMGLYTSDLTRLGMLSENSVRACRVVVDTGLHHFGWSRARAIQYLVDNSPATLELAAAEVDRYVAWPGQALAYMMGRREILRLRENARQVRGARFDIADFHDVVLAEGAVPLPILAERVERWAES